MDIIILAFAGILFTVIFIGGNNLKNYLKNLFWGLNNSNPLPKQKPQHHQRFAPTAPFSADLVYKLQDSILTNRETDFYHMLQYTLKDTQYIIAIKPRMADFIKVNLNQYKDPDVFWHFFNKISAKHVDFLILDSSLKPTLAVELDDASHEREDRKERDILVDNIYKAIELNVFHFNTYTLESIRALLSEFLIINSAVPV